MVIPKLKFSLYGIIIVISVFIGILYIYFSMKEDIKKNKNILLFYIMYIVFAFVFGKMYTYIMTLKGTVITAGLSAYGGLLGVIIASIIFEYIIPLKGKLIKSSILSLPLVYGLTKIACFISGCCHGILYEGPFKVIYPQGLNVGQFPVQLSETIVFLIIFVICHKLKNKNNIEYITLILISIFKFLLDFLRFDHLKILITKNQYFSIILLVITIIIFIKNRNNSNTKKINS